MKSQRLLFFSFALIYGVLSNEIDNIPASAVVPETPVESSNEVLVNSGEVDTATTSQDLTLLEVPETSESELHENATIIAKNTTNVFINCTLETDTKTEVELVNSTQLLIMLVVNPNITRAMAANCLGVYFFARWCPFSTMAAPHINALPRAFPSIRMVAVDAMKYHMFNTQYGVVGVPTFILFHNGRPAVKFNETEYTLERFSTFVTKFTKIHPEPRISVTSADFNGPVPSVVVKEPDYFLWLSWAFLALSAVVFFMKSSLYRKIVEAVKVTWRESEAQHDHMD